ncbi:hypothetical protein PybrP1_010181 [[Pythium] brassicae (nom. inval.)]|nr:hypothetical protein PybrP1_010181 [[Pythium] brassicae (nom. inval.)]
MDAPRRQAIQSRFEKESSKPLTRVGGRLQSVAPPAMAPAQAKSSAKTQPRRIRTTSTHQPLKATTRVTRVPTTRTRSLLIVTRTATPSQPEAFVVTSSPEPLRSSPPLTSTREDGDLDGAVVQLRTQDEGNQQGYRETIYLLKVLLNDLRRERNARIVADSALDRSLLTGRLARYSRTNPSYGASIPGYRREAAHVPVVAVGEEFPSPPFPATINDLNHMTKTGSTSSPC